MIVPDYIQEILIYSPHLNPIEQIWRQMKREIKHHYLESREFLQELTDKVYIPMQHIESYKRFKCICPIHGEFFTNLINIHKGIGCPDCTPKGESLGERAVRIYLQHKGVEYIQEYNVQDKQYFDTFARIDFYIPEKNMFIEFQGEQHYNIAASKIMHNSRGWQKQKKRDNHLRAYAKSKGISLVEIPYTYRNYVSGFLDKYFQ